MPDHDDKKKPVDAFFNRHKDSWKTKVYQELKVKVSIQKFFKPSQHLRIPDRLDDTPTEEKRPRKP